MITREPLRDKTQTIARIFQVARVYYHDLENIYIEKRGNRIPVSALQLSDFFNFVKSLPYKRDGANLEIVARPFIILQRVKNYGRDCKKACVLLGSFFNLNSLKWRIVTVSTRGDKEIHHVFPQLKTNTGYVNYDATYSSMKPGENKIVTAAEYFYESGVINSYR